MQNWPLCDDTSSLVGVDNDRSCCPTTHVMLLPSTTQEWTRIGTSRQNRHCLDRNRWNPTRVEWYKVCLFFLDRMRYTGALRSKPIVWSSATYQFVYVSPFIFSRACQGEATVSLERNTVFESLQRVNPFGTIPFCVISKTIPCIWGIFISAHENCIMCLKLRVLYTLSPRVLAAEGRNSFCLFSARSRDCHWHCWCGHDSRYLGLV